MHLSIDSSIVGVVSPIDIWIFSEATMAVEGKLPAVPETILKRRKRQAENRALRAKDAVKS